MAVAIPVLLVKAHVRAYDRTQGGKLVHVGDYDDKRMRRDLAEHSANVRNTVVGLFAKRPPSPSVPPGQQRESSSSPPAADRKQKPPGYGITADTGWQPTPHAPAKEPQQEQADAPPPSVTTGVQRLKEHGEDSLVSDFAKLPPQEHAKFLNWLKVYDRDLASDPKANMAETYLRVVKRLAGMDVAPKGEAPAEKPVDRAAFAKDLEKHPDGISFTVPRSHSKGLVGTWQKVTLGNETWWKKGEKYRQSEEFAAHADSITAQLAAGGTKKATPVVRATRSTKAPIKPLEEQQGAAKKEAVDAKQSDIPESTAMQLPEEHVGNTGKAWTEKGTEIQFRYAIVPRENLITSHDTQLRENAAFPQALQPRDRARAGLEDQVNSIAKNLNPERLGENPNAGDGAPIISKDGVVESGNGRTLGLGVAYEGKSEKATAYQAWLTKNAAKFGLTAEAVDSIKEPVLVRIRTSDVDRKAFVGEANVPTQAGMSPSERAIADAEKLTPDLMRWFAPSEDGDVAVKENGQFVSRFFKDVIGNSERNLYLTDQGDLNQEGVRRVKNAVLARAFPDAQLVANLTESTSTTIRNVGNALVAASPRIAQLRDGIARGELFPLDPGTDIAAAANKLAYLKREKIPLEDYLNQQQMFGADLSPLGKEFLQVMADHARTPKQLREFFGTYADVAERAGDPRQSGMFGQSAPTKAEVLEATRRIVAKKGAEDDEGQLFAKSEGVRGSGIVIPVLFTPKNREAGTFRDARRKDAPVPAKRIKSVTSWRGLRINIEQPVNSIRWWKDGDGTLGGTRFAYAYGEFPDVPGMDGDPLDCFLGPDLDAGQVYVITIMKHPDFTEEDEQKVMLGFRSQADAVNAFLLHYDDPRMMGSVQAEDAGEYATQLQQGAAQKVAVGMVKSLCPVLFVKSHVVGHWRTESDGKRTYVKEHEDSRHLHESAVAAIRAWQAAGKPRLEALGSNLRDAQRAVAAATHIERDYFWRGTNRKGEHADVKRGVPIISTNHTDGTKEKGMSVSRTLATVFAYGYKHAYKVKGDVVGHGSDGEPILSNVKPASRLLPADEAIANDEDRAEKIRRVHAIAEATGETPDIVRWIGSR